MAEWIDINLPWQRSYVFQGEPPAPSLTEEEVAHFGISLDDLSVKLDYDRLKQMRGEEIAKLRADFKKRQLPDYGDQWNQAQEILYDAFAKKHPGIKEFEDKIKEYDAWDAAHPAFQAWKAACAKHEADFKQSHFVGRGLAIPGTLIEMMDGSTYLIGDINQSGGQCNCCLAFEEEQEEGIEHIVKRYKVVYVTES